MGPHCITHGEIYMCIKTASIKLEARFYVQWSLMLTLASGMFGTKPKGVSLSAKWI